MQTQRFDLRTIQPQDKPHIFKGLSNPELTRYYDVHFPTLEATQEQMDWYKDLEEKQTGKWWGIFEKGSDQFCGAGGYCDWNHDHKKAEIGFWLLPEYWGRGIMKEVMPALFEYGFMTMKLNRIEGYVISDNTKCKKGLTKINFTYEGTMRECEWKNGAPIHVDIYSLIKSEWNNDQ